MLRPGCHANGWLLFVAVLPLLPRLARGNCTLCEDGSPLPEPNKALFPDKNGTMQTCQELQAQSNAIDPAQCPSFQGVYGVYCGCNNPTSSKMACRICGGDKLLPDPSLETVFEGVENSTEKISCGVSEFATTNFPETLPCDVSQARYGEECCQEEDTSTAAAGPSSASVAWTVLELVFSSFVI